jgi:ribonuclease HI
MRRLNGGRAGPLLPRMARRSRTQAPGAGLGVTADGRGAGGGAKHTTNNRMELRAVLELLLSIRESEGLHVQTDSSYVMNVFTVWLPRWVRGACGRPGGSR